jgi:hypothetical protein
MVTTVEHKEINKASSNKVVNWPCYMWGEMKLPGFFPPFFTQNNAK